MAFVLHVPIVRPCLVECVVTYFNEVYILKEHEAVFLKKQDLIFCIVAKGIWFVFWFKISCYIWGSRGLGVVNLDIPRFKICVSNQTDLIWSLKY